MDNNQTNQQPAAQTNVQQVPQAAPAAPAAPAPVVAAPQVKQELEQTVEQAQAKLAGPKEVPLSERPTEITITIPTQAYFMSGIRDFVVNLTKNMTGFSEQWAYRFQAVVDELCNNAIEHGSMAGEMIKIVLISTRSESLEVLVEDTGTGKEKMTAAQITALFEERKQMMTHKYLGFRGRGLPKIVGEWTDEVLFEDAPGGGLRVRVKKYLRKEEDTVSSVRKNDPTHLVIK